jgi:hypothetical protein
MILENLTKGQLVEILDSVLCECKVDCPPFKMGERYFVEQHDYGVDVRTDDGEWIEFNYDEAHQLFKNY